MRVSRVVIHDMKEGIEKRTNNEMSGGRIDHDNIPSLHVMNTTSRSIQI